MPVVKEFAIRQEDKPGTLGKLCQALANENINILAFQAFPAKRDKSDIHLVLDNPAGGQAIFDRLRVDYTETEVAQVKLAHNPGELARAATRLGDAKLNINYGYSGLETETNAPILILGVADAGKAVKLLEQAAAAGASS